MKYYVTNRYGIAGETAHRSARAALRARDAREGLGWVVTDEAGNYYDGQKSDNYSHIERMSNV